MADEKKISAKQAGIAVLKKFEELLLKAKEKNISVTDLSKAESLKKDDGVGLAGGMDGMACSEELKKDDAPPPTVPGGTTINSQIGNPFGKAEGNPEWEGKRSELSHAKYHAEQKVKAAHNKLVDPMSLKQYMGHIHGKKYADYTAPAGGKHAQNLKDFHVAHQEHQAASKAYKEHMASAPESMHKSEDSPKKLRAITVTGYHPDDNGQQHHDKFEGSDLKGALAHAKQAVKSGSKNVKIMGHDNFDKVHDLTHHLGTTMHKSESNPDEKQDAQLGEQVEKDVQQHMEQNPEAHPDHCRGHYKLAKFVGRIEGKRAAQGMNQDSGNNTPAQPINGMAKSAESKHDRCVEHVKENSPEVKNPHAVCVAEGVKPANQK